MFDRAYTAGAIQRFKQRVLFRLRGALQLGQQPRNVPTCSPTDHRAIAVITRSALPVEKAVLVAIIEVAAVRGYASHRCYPLSFCYQQPGNATA